jgi:hypothetical protein
MRKRMVVWSGLAAVVAAVTCISFATMSVNAQVREKSKSQVREQTDEQVREQAEVEVEEQSEEESPAQAYRASSVLGSKVSIEGNVAIGTVDDIVFTDDGYLEYLIINNENKLVTVPWEAAKFNFEQRTAVVNITPERFKAVPTYTVEQYPTFAAPTYRVETYRYYGLTPRERRAIRRKLD